MDNSASLMPRHRAIHIADTAIPLLALAALLALRGPGLISSGLNNLASIRLAPEWRAVTGAGQAPACLVQLPQSAGRNYALSALQVAPSDERARLNVGRTYWLEGRCTEAVIEWQHAADLAESDPVPPILLATGHFVAGDTSAWTRFLGTESAVQYAANNAVQASLEGDPADVLAWREIAFAVQPSRPFAERLANLYTTAGRTSDAVNVWLKLVEVSLESDAEHWWALGRNAALTSDWTGAAAAYARGAMLADDPYDYWLQAGLASLNARDGAAAERYFTRALAARPETYSPTIYLGRAKYLQNDFAAALVWFQRAEQLSPAIVDPKYWSGLAYWQQKDYPQAKRSFQQVLKLDPKHTSSRYYLARSDYELGHLPEAIDSLQQALDLARRSTSPTKPWDWALLLGDWQAQAGDRPAALASYRLALEWHPNDPTIQKRIDALR